jgi:hypothetical protein
MPIDWVQPRSRVEWKRRLDMEAIVRPFIGPGLDPGTAFAGHDRPERGFERPSPGGPLSPAIRAIGDPGRTRR